MKFFLQRRNREDNLDDEIRSHLDMAASDRIERGESREDAANAARREFGNSALIADTTRDQWGRRWIEDLFADLRHGARMWRKNPGFTAVAVLTLALGIGANTSIFSAVDAVLLRPLPYKDPSRLMVMWADLHRRHGPAHEWTNAADFYDWRAQSKTFEDMALLDTWGPTLNGPGEPQLLAGGAVSNSMFSMLGVSPALGRDFTSDDDRPNGPHVVLLSDALWRRQFDASPSILGQTLNLDGMAYTVIGVMPPTFQSPIVPNRELWTTLQAAPDDRGNAVLRAVGRIRIGVNFAQAQTEMDTIARRLEQAYPRDNAGVGVALVPLQEQFTGAVRKPLLILLGAVTLVLLIACANVAHLLLARAASRQKEISVRTALGAGRMRVVRQLLTESCLLAIAGGIVGLLLAYWSAGFLTRALPPAITALAPVKLNLAVLFFTVGVSVLTGLIFGMAPAWQMSRPNLSEALRESGRATGGRSRQRLRSALVIADVALALTLAVGAGLLLKSFSRLTAVDLGFHADHVLETRLFLPSTSFPDMKRVAQFYPQLLEKLSALRGVVAASAISTPPLAGPGAATDAGFFIEGRPAPPPGQRASAWYSVVAPNFHETLRIPLLRGRTFTEQDLADKPSIAVINESMARRFWPDEDPIGKRFAFGNPARPNPLWREIVGVVGNVKYFGLDQEQPPSLYLPFPQAPQRGMTLMLRTTGPPEAMASAVRETVWAMQPSLAIPGFSTMNEAVSSAADQPRLLSVLTGAFAVIALVMAAVGLYGVMAYVVLERTKELGIRMAIGATPASVLRMILGQGIRLALLGIAVGLVASLALTRVLSSLLFQVGDRDPATFALVSVLLVAVAALACYFPARRAMKVDPMVALRYE